MLQELEKFAYNVAEEVVTSMEQQERKVGIMIPMLFVTARTSLVINVRCTGSHNLSFHGLKQREIELVKAQHVSRGMRRSF